MEGRRTEEAQIGAVVDPETAVDFGHGRENHRSGSETEDVNGYTEGA